MSDTIEEVVLAPPLAQLSSLLETKPQALATGDTDIQLAALQAAKFVFDHALETESKSRAQLVQLLNSISPAAAPRTRSQTAASNGKRKRDGSASLTFLGPMPQETPLSELLVDGMDEDQLWTQLELRTANVCEILEYALETTGQLPESDDEKEGEGEGADGDVDMEDSDDADEEDEDEEDEDEEEDNGIEDEDFGEEMTHLRDPSDEPSSDLDLDKPSFQSNGKRTIRVKPRKGGHPLLDDGFFNLAAFNAETEEAEARTVSKGRLGRDSDDEDDEDEQEEIDFFASVDHDVEGDTEEGQDLLYTDFFEPPAKVTSQPKKVVSTNRVRFHDQVRVKTIKATGKSLPLAAMYAEEDDENDDDYDANDGMEVDEDAEDESEDDEEEDANKSQKGAEIFDEQEDHFGNRVTIDRFKDDLFMDDERTDDGLSTHEKRLAALQEEISSLEAENVAKKHWTLMGEATSRSRPQNALLEEDVEFERVMKSVPVITEETVQGLEDLIKTRILESRFDDVIRRRAEDDKPFLPSRFFELQDTKSKQSLAEIYEDEYTTAQTGGVTGEDRDGKLKKEHDEIEKLWDSICGKLDALCNAHFTPKAPKTTISSIANISTATLESALPTIKATTTLLAPEEVFAPSPSDLRARSELTPLEKQALHNRHKKANRKARDKLDNAVDKYAKVKGARRQKEAALMSVVKSGRGVTVIGKEGIKAKKKQS